MVAVFGLLMTEIAMIYFSVVSNNRNQSTYKENADNLSSLVAEVVDSNDCKVLKDSVKSIVDSSKTHPFSDEWGSDEWNEYIAQFDGIYEMPEFTRVRDYLRKIADSQSDELNCIYIAYLEPSINGFVYVVDSAPDDDACPPGCIDPIYDFNKETLTNPSRGLPAYITNTPEYGYLVTSGSPIYVGDEVIGYALCDISMTAVRARQRNRIIRLFVYMIITNVLISVMAAFVVHFVFIKPLKKITDVAKGYNSSDPAQTHERFLNLDVRTHDELKDLSDALKKVENDVYNQLNELKEMNLALIESHSETKKMTELANKDSLTGVRNKIAYNAEVEKLNEEIKQNKDLAFGLVMIDLNDLKLINDQFGHDNGDIALVNLTNIICTIFAHSPVYRFGGDEFVILLKNADYEKVDQLVDDFNFKLRELSKDKSLSKAEQASAAIGYALFDRKVDKEVDDVFRRADERMYQRKRQMKEGIKK